MIIRDSIDPTLIPLDSDAVAGYGDGIYEWTSAGWARFPVTTPRLVIVVSATDAGDVLDVERGDATPSDCPGWADRFARPGRRLPTIYCDRNTIAAVRGAMAGRPFDWWAATLDGTTDVAGAVAVQAWDRGPYDESIVHDPGWLQQEVTMNVRTLWHDPASGAIWYQEGLILFHIEAPADAQALQASGVPQVDVSAQFLADLEAAAGQLRVSGSLTVSGNLAVS